MNQTMIGAWRARLANKVLDNQKGVIISWTKILVAPEPFDYQVPYFLAVIALDNGQSIMCPIADVHEDEIDFGVRVQFVTRILHCPDSNSIITYGTKTVII